MTTILQDLLAEATVDSSKMESKQVTWTRLDNDGKEVSSVYDIFIIVEPSFASSDRMLLGDPRAQDASRQARTIAERIRFGKKGEEAMTFAQASALKPTLGWALASAVYEFDKEREPKVVEGDEAPKD